jgi:sterol desaturase/sphingolipid hydroxylase (fatty acid hydroxylase superfamily)
MSVRDQIFHWMAATYSVDAFFAFWSLVAGLCVMLHVAERVLPAERHQSYGFMIANGKITLVYAFLSPISRLAAIYFVGTGIGELSKQLTAPGFLIDLGSLINGCSGPIKYVFLMPIALMPLLLYDFFYYWFHRLQHTSAWLWEQHKLHHSDQALNVTTSHRINWIEEFFKLFLVTIPVALILKLQPVQVGTLASFAVALSIIWGLFLHSNIRLCFGAMTPVVTGPHFHRIHHSIETRHRDRNFATYLPLWDILFGTFYPPTREEYPQTGVVNEISNPSMREIMLGPLLCWVHWMLGFAVRLIRKAKVTENAA